MIKIFLCKAETFTCGLQSADPLFPLPAAALKRDDGSFRSLPISALVGVLCCIAM